jgi:ABC-type transporter Mla subunit MlaD
MSRRPTGSIVANPILVGAVTALVVVVAVFLAYNANKGLPFVPTTQIKFQVSNGANLLPGNEVREGGHRIGIVDDMKPIRLPDGTVGAEASMHIDASAGKIPADSTLDLRPRSVLGLKYVELTRGRSKEMLEDGSRLSADRVTYPVELDDFNRIFDERTRSAVRQNLKGFGNALSSRGPSLNTTIMHFPRFLRHLEPVAEELADPTNRLDRFFKELGDAARIVAPEAERYAHSFEAGADVFEAWSRYPDRLQLTLRDSSYTMDVGIRSFRVQRPFLADVARFSRSLRRAAEVMPGTLPGITRALRTGIPVQRRTPEINRELRLTFGALRDLMADDRTIYALRGVTRLVDVVHPLIRFVGPYITVCNYFNYAWTNAGEHLTEPDPTGGSQRTLLNQFSRPRDPRASNMGSNGATVPANGEETASGAPMNFHTNYYTAAITPNGEADCESGQRGYPRKLTTYDQNQDLEIVTDPRTPGVQGRIGTGRSRVPEGQTFSRTPEIGPPFPREQDR